MTQDAAVTTTEAKMALLAISFPVLDSNMDLFKKFLEELNGPRKAEYSASRASAGVRERAFLQHTPNGSMVIVTLEGEDPVRALARFGSDDDAFSRWFRQQAKEIHGVDLAVPPPGPLPELVADSAA
jgi:hypothetical protein